MTENTLAIKKTVRYHTIGKIEKAKYLLIALHGYGQLPSYFGRKFENLSDEYFIVLPEGMHRFYLVGSSGKVGASWMTKEAREQDINDNLHYLNDLISQFTDNHSFKKIILLGFSQGGATAARFFYHAKNKIDHLILWASIFPPDLKIDNEIQSDSMNNYFVLGNEDNYFSEELTKETMNFYSNLGFKTIQYLGNHSIDYELLNELLSQLK